MKLFQRRRKRADVWTAIPLSTTRLLLVPVFGHTKIKRSGDFVFYDVTDEVSREHLGTAGLFWYLPDDLEEPGVVINWVLGYEHYNKGYSTEILNVLTEESFRWLNVPDVLVDGDETSGNPTKANVAAMSGFLPFKHVGKQFYWKGRP
jgi:hypothetical protein